jgi:autotransporter-associated beta strand protein
VVLGSGVAYGQTVPAGIVAETPNNTTTTILLDPQNPSVAVISNGLQSGGNLYHRFSQFDTTRSQDQLSRVLFDLANSSTVQNLIVGVSATAGSLISVPIVLSQSANLLFLSPYGIVMSGAAGFGFGSAVGSISPLEKVAITTANMLDFTTNTTTASSFEVVPTTPSPTKGYPDGSPNPQLTGLTSLANVGGKIILDGQTGGSVSLVVEQALMVAELVPSAIPQVQETLAPVQVKGQVTLGLAGTGTIYGAFNLGEWSNNAWTNASLIATSGSGALNWDAPVAVKPGSEFKLQATGNGAITLQGLVSLYGWETTNSLSFAKLVSSSGDHTVAGGIELFGPGRIEVQTGSLQINDDPNTNAAISANYTNNNATNNWGAINDAYNLLFDIAPAADATVNGAIILGDGGVTKLGDGILTFSSPNNSYTGPTNVLAGYLQVDGPVPDTVSCSNSGNSNRCSGQDSDIDWEAWLEEEESYDDGDLAFAIDESDPDSSDEWAMEEGSDFNLDSGEGSLTAPGLDVDLAVNDSFAVTDSGNEATANGSTGADGSPSNSITAMQSQPATEPLVSSVGSQEAGVALSRSDNQATLSALQSLAPERLAGGIPSTPTPQQLQMEMQRQVQQIRSGAGGFPSGQLRSQRSDQSNWIASTTLLAAGPALPSFQRSAYQPAVVHLRFSEERPSPSPTAQRRGTDAFLDITLIPLAGPVEGRRVEVSKKLFSEQLRDLYGRLSRQESLDPANPKAAARQLFNQLIGPIIPQLQAKGVTTLLIAADRGLQAIPFAAPHDGSQYFGDRYSFSITPSLALTNLSAPEAVDKVLLLAGASMFDGLAPLPLVPQELQEIGAKSTASIFLNRDFTPDVLLEKAADPRYSRIHIATHAEFLPGGPSSSYLYSGVGPIPLTAFSRLRLQRKGAPLDLITFSACRTALGDPNSELGFAGLAVQAGARSAAGTLWYVDDVASSAYFQQMYRYLDQGVPKAEALQLTRQAFLRGFVHLEGDRLLGPNGSILLRNLTKEQQRRVKDGLQNPYFWAGVELIGSPW